MKNFLWLLLLLTYPALGQISNLREKFYPEIQDTVVLDTLPIIPSSVIVKEKGKITQNYLLLWQRSMLIVSYPMDSVEVIYRVFPFRFALVSEADTSKPFIMPKYSEIEPIPQLRQDFETPALNTDGRISRGIFFGSNQQPAMTSDLSFTMNGYLDDSIRIEATISNNSLNNSELSGTYNLQDFDKTLIKITFPRAQLIMGDFEASNSKPYFLRYHRAVKGGELTKHFVKEDLRLGIGTQKGKFNRMAFRGQEGNQGPYRLQSKDGKEFIVVVSGSERVYIDGQLKQRGADKDYIMDYNRGEITFTANCLITKDTRIVIEYEYWDVDFVKLAYWADYSHKIGNSYFYGDFYQLRDNPNSAITHYSKEQMQLLYSIGDSVEKALWTAADSLGYSNEKILYCRKDTVWNGQQYQIFVYSDNPQCAVWQVSFLYVGQGKGDYKLSEARENGRVFVWIGPGRGDYLPMRKLSVPQTKAVALTGGEIYVSDNFSATYEIARGYQDKNLFSPIDDKDNITYNFRLGFDKLLHSTSVAKNEIIFDYMLMNQFFPVFDRFLDVEFERDWNITSVQVPTGHFLALKNILQTYGGWKINTNLQGFFAPQKYSGTKLDLTISLDTSKWKINSWLSYNTNKQQDFSSHFFRTKQIWTFYTHKFSVSLFSEAEHNIMLSDSLLPTSYAFWDNKIELTFGDSTANYWIVSLGNRRDFLPQNNELFQWADAWTLRTKWNIKKKNFYNQLIANYRILQDSAVNTNILLQERTEIRLFKWLNISFIQSLQQGMQPITEFYFVKVPTGQGQYTWVDFNNDGRQQLNEFQITQFTEQANYIRIVLPTNKYIPIIGSSSNFSFSLIPHLSSGTAFANLLNKLQNNFTLSLESKNTNNQPVILNHNDTNVIFYNFSLTNNLIYALNSKIKFNYLRGQNINKDLLVGGMKFTFIGTNIFSFIYDLSSKGQVKASFSTKRQQSQNQLFLSDNYLINMKGAQLSYTYSNYKSMIDLTVQSNWSTELTTEAFLRNISVNLTANQVISQRFRLMLLSKLIYNDFNGQEQGQVTYVLLQGYSDGLNIDNLLSLSFKINKAFTVSTDLQMRKTSIWIYNFGFRITGWF